MCRYYTIMGEQETETNNTKRETKMSNLNEKQLKGNKRPERGPYPKGVANGPDPTTERGKKRRRNNVA